MMAEVLIFNTHGHFPLNKYETTRWSHILNVYTMYLKILYLYPDTALVQDPCIDMKDIQRIL